MKRLNEMDYNEMKAIIESNDEIERMVKDYAIDCIFMDLTEEALWKIPAQYEFSLCSYTQINLNDEWDMINVWFKKQHDVYGEYSDEIVKMAGQGEILAEKLRYWDLSETNYDRIESKLEDIKEALEEAVIDMINSRLNALDDIEYLTDTALACGIFDDNYYEEDGEVYYHHDAIEAYEEWIA